MLGAQTLLKMATQAAIRYASMIEDFADMPYELARPILLALRSPQQLRDIEVNCPQIAKQSEELWKGFIERDIPDWEKKMVYPKNPGSWHKVYAYLKRQEDKKAADDEEALRKAVQGEVFKKTTNEALFVNRVLPHSRAEDKTSFYIDGASRNDFSVRRRNPTLKNAKTGKDALAAIRRQAAQAHKEKTMGSNWKGLTDAQKLERAKTQIKAAPKSMSSQTTPRSHVIPPRDLLSHERSILYGDKDVQIQPPSRNSRLGVVGRYPTPNDAATRQNRAENEAKLRALTRQCGQPASSPAPNVFKFSESALITERTKSVPLAAHNPSDKPASTESVATGSTLSPPSHPPHPSPVESREFSPPKTIKKRPTTSIFMKNKKRKV